MLVAVFRSARLHCITILESRSGLGLLRNNDSATNFLMWLSAASKCPAKSLHSCIGFSLCRDAAAVRVHAMNTVADEFEGEANAINVVMDTPSSGSCQLGEQQCKSSLCTPYIGIQMRQTGPRHRDDDSQGTHPLDDHRLTVQKERACCEECMEGQAHGSTGNTQDPLLTQPESARLGRKAHGNQDIHRNWTVGESQARAIQGPSNTDGARSTHEHAQTGQLQDLQAGLFDQERTGFDGNRSDSGLTLSLRRGRPRLREVSTQRRTARSSQRDGIARDSDDSNKENRDPQARTVWDRRTQSSQ